MKLSEAVRLAGLEHPQAFGAFYVKLSDGKEALCALGGAYKMVGGDPIGLQFHLASAFINFRVMFPILDVSVKASYLAVIPDLPIVPVLNVNAKESYWTVMNFTAFLNDQLKWSRNQIADWLEVVEADFEPEEKQLLEPAYATCQAT